MKKLIIIIVIIAVAAGAAFAWTSRSDTDEDTSNDQSSQTTEETTNQQSSEEPAADTEIADTITYTSDGFSVDNSTVSSGSTIEVVNDSDQTLDFASNEHPVHTDNSEFNVGTIEPGQSATFIATETGTWGFHNHLNAAHEAEIVVE